MNRFHMGTRDGTVLGDSTVRDLNGWTGDGGIPLGIGVDIVWYGGEQWKRNLKQKELRTCAEAVSAAEYRIAWEPTVQFTTRKMDKWWYKPKPDYRFCNHLANHKGCKQFCNIIKTWRKYMQLMGDGAWENQCEWVTIITYSNYYWFCFTFDWLRKWRQCLKQSLGTVMQHQSKCELYVLFDTQVKTTLMKRNERQ